MNKELIEEAAYITYREVQVAVAIFVIKNCPTDENIADYALKFQNQYRQKTERCNIRLERKILIEQLFRLLPELSHILLKSEIFPIPMEVDINGIIDADYVDFSLQLSVATELLHALIGVRILLKKNTKIQSNEIISILSKFGDLNLKNFNTCSQHPITEISAHLFQQVMQKIDVEKIAKVCVSLIVDLFKSYLSNLPQRVSLSREEALIWMKKANYLLMKCVDGFAYDGQYQLTILNLLQNSIRYIFTENQSRIKWCNEDEYCKMIMKWKYQRLLCINAVNEFFIALHKITQDLTEMNKNKCIDILKAIKSFLDFFCKHHFKKENLNSNKEDSGFGTLSIATEDIPISDGRLMISWAKYLSNLVSKIENDDHLILQLASKCCNLLLSTGVLDKFEELKNYKNNKSRNHLT